MDTPRFRDSAKVDNKWVLFAIVASNTNIISIEEYKQVPFSSFSRTLIWMRLIWLPGRTQCSVEEVVLNLTNVCLPITKRDLTTSCLFSCLNYHDWLSWSRTSGCTLSCCKCIEITLTILPLFCSYLAYYTHSFLSWCSRNCNVHVPTWSPAHPHQVGVKGFILGLECSIVCCS